ncbi:hypothetical protein GCM10009654_23000 [Streptomyces hebeiensis]|uniref:Uncharacterized protein n=1 Tax=Streptomyces hebeiensis TaxID=229486 RepID=A0ABN1UT60_9ACTN
MRRQTMSCSLSPNYELGERPGRSCMVENWCMDAPELLESVSQLVPEETATENDITV